MQGRTNAISFTNSKEAYCFIKVTTTPANATCTCVQGSISAPKYGTSSPYIFAVPSSGNWTVTATINGTTQSSVVASERGYVHERSFVFEKKLYTNGTKDVAWTTDGTVTFGTSYATLSKSVSGYNGGMRTTSAISLAGYSTLKVVYTTPNGVTGPQVKFGINSGTSAWDELTVATNFADHSSKYTGSLNISSYTGSFYVYLVCRGTGIGMTYINVYEVWLSA